MTTEEEIKDIVAGIVHCDKALITRESTFRDLKADSLDIVQILIAVESKYSIEIPDDKAHNFQNFGEFVDYVEKVTS